MNRILNCSRQRGPQTLSSAFLSATLFTLSGNLFAQRPPETQPRAANAGAIAVTDVCAAAIPQSPEGSEIQWSPDGGSIASLKSLESGFGVRMELDVVNSTGSDRRVLLSQAQMDHLFPARPSADGDVYVPPLRSAMGFQWGPDSGGLLVYSDAGIAWLDRKTLETRSLIAGKQVIADVQLSPDGHWASFVRDHNLWLVSVAGGPERAVTQGGSPTLRKGELDWMYPAELGTKHGYAWSPDSARIAWFEFDLKDVENYTPPFQGDDDSAQSIDYPTAGTPNPIVRILVTPIKKEARARATAVAINTGTDKESYLPRLQWLPDSKRLAFQRLDRPQSRLELLIADATTGTSRLVLTENDPYWINLSDILYFLEDSSQFVWASERSGYRHLYLYDLDGKLVRPLTEGNWEVTALASVNEKQQKIYFVSTQKSPLERHLYVAGLDGSGMTRVSGESGTHEATFSPDGSAYVDNFSTATKPWMRSIFRIDGKAETKSNSAAAKVFSLDAPPATGEKKPLLRPVDFLTMKTHDGVELNAMMIRPPGFAPEKKYPVVVYVYGGPGHQVAHDQWDGDISMWQQMLAQRGNLVFAVDNRGSSGRGHVFEEFLHLRLIGQEMADQRDGVRFLQSLPYIDPARIGVWGRGFGGSMVMDSMLHQPIFFKAGFAVAPIINWFHYDSAFAERYLGDRVKNQDGYISSSPTEYAKFLKGPLLIGQGTADLEVHPDQVMEMQHEFVEKQKYAEIALFPGLTHNIDKPEACSVLYQRATELFGKSL